MKFTTLKSLKSLLLAASLFLPLQQVVAQESEFIENMPQLTQDPDRPGAMIWQKEGVDRSVYTKVMLEPITLFISPNSKYKGLDPDELKAVTDGFVEAATKALEPEIPVVHAAGPGVLYVRAAITNVNLANKKRKLMQYTPVGLVTSSVMNAAGMRISLKEAVLEIETLDSVSGERVSVMVDKSPTVAEKEKLSWESVANTLTYYADRFKARMQAAH